MNTHKVKCHAQFFRPVWKGEKTFEVRVNDRDYKVGDIVILKEWDWECEAYMGRQIRVVILYILDTPEYCKDKQIIFSFKELNRRVY